MLASRLAPRRLVALSRGLAKKAKPVESAAPVSAPGASNVVRGCNILKDGEDPTIKPDEEYPDWLWTMCEALHSMQPSLAHGAHPAGVSRGDSWPAFAALH
eukprot:scaffold56570_cov34-Tisochrysis_lutea.AAC.5